MNVKDRMLQFLKYEKLSQSKFERAVGLSNGFVNNIGAGISTTSLKKISDKYPNLNTTWLLTGEGEMIIKLSSPFESDDPNNWERAAIKALSWGLANALSEISDLKGKRRDPADYLEEIDRNTNMILHDLRKSGKN